MCLDKCGKAPHSEYTGKIFSEDGKTVAFAEQGNIECDNKKICNLANPVVGSEAESRKYLNKLPA